MTTTPDRSPVSELPPILPPIACTSWCEHGDGHPGLRHAVDQRCETEEARAYLHNRKDNDDGRLCDQLRRAQRAASQAGHSPRRRH
jgi:hypothetical protein